MSHFVAPVEVQPRTLNEAVYRTIRVEILRGELRPGQRLMFDTLKARYEVGTSPLREAMSRLAAEGLIEFESHKGARVAAISMGDFRDLVSLRQLVECEALRRSIELGDDHWEAALVAGYHYYTKAARDQNAVSDTRESRHHAFHRSLLAACGSKRLLDTCEIYYAQSERYRQLGLAFRHLQRKQRDGNSEHRLIMEAAIERDAAAACKRLGQHLERTIDEVSFALDQLEPPPTVT